MVGLLHNTQLVIKKLISVKPIKLKINMFKHFSIILETMGGVMQKLVILLLSYIFTITSCLSYAFQAKNPNGKY